MPDDRKKMFSKKGTGTVPKIKHRNNTSHVNQSDFQRNLSNNLGLDWQRHDYSNYSRNSGRNFYQLNPYTMEASVSDEHRPNGVSQLNMTGTANGTLSTSSTSESNSRRDSVGTIPKCDNVKKCPDKKQIEDKLSQIREYLRVTTSLMSSIKNNEDQSAAKDREDFERMIKDLKDSEAKLLVLLDDPLYDDDSEQPELQIIQEENHNMDIAVSEHMQRFSQLIDILACQQDKFNNICNTNNGPLENGLDISEPGVSGYHRNELEEKVEFTNRKVQLLREQQNALLNLKRKAENQLRDAHQARENLLLMEQQQQQQQKSANQLRNVRLDQDASFSESQPNDKNFSENRFDAAIKELEDRLDSMRNDPRRSTLSNQDNTRSNGDYIEERLDGRNQLLHLLDNRDTQLNSEHMELQQKLSELHQKKMQIDHLAEQLQTLGDDDDEDIGNQVRKIVTMKQQLSSLKDLLEIVKNTECTLLDTQNVNELDLESQENAHGSCTKTDNIRQDVRTHRNQNGNSSRMENKGARANEQWVTEKQSNKSLINIQEREKVLAELKAKKRELEEIMYKQKDRTSINNDVCSETSVNNKSDLVTNNNMFDSVVMSWLPVRPIQHNQVTSAYSSDDCPEEDINEYSDLNSSADVTVGTIPQPQPPLTSNYSTPSFSKRGSGLDQRSDAARSEFIRHSSPRTSERSIPAVPVPAPLPAFERERTLSNTISEADTNKVQLQKQLELIQCVCQSLLDQQASNNVQQLRNNLTPSPMYTEPRSYISSSQRLSVPNTINPADVPYLNPQSVNPQCFALGDIANNQNMLAANTLQTQAFLLNTLNQCCQMLWFQQREIASLRNMICTMQEQMVNGPPEQQPSLVPPPPSSYVFPRPVSSLSNFRAPSQPRNVINPKVNQVSAACSLPNLNPSCPHANIDSAYVNQSNIRSSPSARLLESSLNNTAPIHSHHNLSGEQPANNTVLPSVNVNASISQPLPSQIWNGQALNNQVAPGNRANNYWDNFRSYSRQNLLSTSSKSNEGLQNPASVASVLERSNTYDRSHSFPLHPFTVPKLNMVHNESTNASEESTPRRHLFFNKTPQNLGSSNKSTSANPPDVLNINHNSPPKTNDHHVLPREIPLDLNGTENNLLLDINGAVGDAQSFKDYPIGSQRNRNEWHDTEQSDNLPKSKLFEELRDNVYKEVANLISANESRPHFLIQLFRDLQHINSDPLRGRTLQSIQTVITNSLNVLEHTRGASRQSSSVQPTNSEQEVVQVDSEYFSLQPSLWSQSPVSTSRDSSNMELENNEDSDIHNILKTIFSFLKSHHDDVLHQELIDLLKDIIIKAMPFAKIFENTNIQERTFHNHFAEILNEAFEKYQGRRITEIRKDLLKTISDVLVGEFSFIYLVQENISDNCENATLPSTGGNNLPLNDNIDNVVLINFQTQQVGNMTEEGNTPQMQNGDLAEADQSRIELQEEEGAVGGVLNVVVETNPVSTDFAEPNVTDLPRIDCSVNAESEVEFVEQGLDQVPTRLTTGSRTHSNTPSRDRSNSSRSDPMEHF